MAGYSVTFSCGHTEQRELCGKHEDRRRKIEWWESEGLCTECYRKKKEAEMLETHDEVEMRYYDYKNGEYSECTTKPESYNKATKTIIVYVPKNKKEK